MGSQRREFGPIDEMLARGAGNVFVTVKLPIADRAGAEEGDVVAEFGPLPGEFLERGFGAANHAVDAGEGHGNSVLVHKGNLTFFEPRAILGADSGYRVGRRIPGCPVFRRDGV